MKKITLLLVLTSFYLISYAQNNEREISKLIIAYNGDSTLLIEKYEIDVTKKKVYYISPIMNYLDIQGVKYRTRIRTNKKEWHDIKVLISAIDFRKLESYNTASTDRATYFTEVTMNKNETYKVIFSEEMIPVEFRKLFETIRKIE
jgi:hypothetical protein